MPSAGNGYEDDQDEVKTVGWGTTETGGLSSYLREADLIVQDDRCKAVYGNFYTERMICATEK